MFVTAVVGIGLNWLRVLRRNADRNVIIPKVTEEIGVHHISFIALVESIVQLKYLRSNQFIIPIYCVKDLVIITVFVNRIIEIFSGCPFLLISKKHHLIFVNSPPLEIPSNALRCLICRSIIYDDNAILPVLLLKQTLQIPSISIIRLIIVCGHNYTSRYLLRYVLSSIFLIEVSFLSLIDFIQLWYSLVLLSSQFVIIHFLKKIIIRDFAFIFNETRFAYIAGLHRCFYSTELLSSLLEMYVKLSLLTFNICLGELQG